MDTTSFEERLITTPTSTHVVTNKNRDVESLRYHLEGGVASLTHRIKKIRIEYQDGTWEEWEAE